jgi:hypothetical protein
MKRRFSTGDENFRHYAYAFLKLPAAKRSK